MKHLVFVGAIYLDTILSVPHFPGEDSKLRASSLSVRRGGNCCNSLEVLQNLLRRAQDHADHEIALHLVSCLPARASAATETLLASFGADTNINFEHCLFREGKTEPASSYIIRSESTGTRTIVNFHDLEEMTVAEFSNIADQFRERGESWWHFEGRIPDVLLPCIRYLRRELPEAKVSVEVEKPSREGLRELAAEADAVFYSRSWAEGHKTNGYASAEACLKGELSESVGGKKLVSSHVPEISAKQTLSTRRISSLTLCTWGAEGAAALSFPGAAYEQYRGTPVARVVDSIGAGDTFIAGVLHRLLRHPQDASMGEVLRFAVDLAGRKVQMEGFGMS